MEKVKFCVDRCNGQPDVPQLQSFWASLFRSWKSFLFTFLLLKFNYL